MVRYAEELPDIALLSISSFQKGLKDPNQLIRASALRVLSSIRVDVIIPIVQIAVNQAAVDMSPYVRKCAAHALPKLYHLDPEGDIMERDSLIEVLDKVRDISHYTQLRALTTAAHCFCISCSSSTIAHRWFWALPSWHSKRSALIGMC